MKNTLHWRLEDLEETKTGCTLFGSMLLTLVGYILCIYHKSNHLSNSVHILCTVKSSFSMTIPVFATSGSTSFGKLQ